MMYLWKYEEDSFELLLYVLQLVWDLHHFQKQFMGEWCKGKIKRNRKLAWFVSMVRSLNLREISQ